MTESSTSIEERVRAALQALGAGELREGAKRLLAELGYRSDRTLDITPNTAEGFIATFVAPNPATRFRADRAHTDDWAAVDLVMQLTAAELNGGTITHVDQGEHQSYLVFAIDLHPNPAGYPRGRLADITREVNKAFEGIPVMIAYRHGNRLTIGVVDRRANRLDPTRDVLGSVTLIHDIDLDNPHRGHIDTLTDLSLASLQRRHGAITTFDQLHQAWSQVLDTRILNEGFFRDYQRLFTEAETKITGLAGDERRMFTQRLFNRLLFIRFLEEKGWVRYGDAPDYLAALWRDHTARGGSNFYRERLERLFFDGLNRPGGAVDDPLIGSVPYLNGGLFDRDHLDNTPGLSVPDDAIQPVLEELFYRYKFTVTEATPLELEVAVDPEMLGKVFEELVTGRHESGSFYTPRPVVQYMCQEALKAYLLDTCPSETADGVRAFVEDRDTTGLHDPEAILEALRDVKVVDPACGSGAYLLGMLQELLELRQTLFHGAGVGSDTVYARKLDIITNNIYGVDLDPFAVNIARMRLWLSLVVDDTRNPLTSDVDVALPNLDFKVEAGDSLTAPNPNQGEGAQIDVFREHLLREYEEEKKAYTTTHGPDRAAKLARVQELREQLRHALDRGAVNGFDWRVEFSEVFNPTGDRRPGFDVVLANPPYVKGVNLHRETRQALRHLYPQGTTGQSDLYVYFYLRTLQLLRPGGLQVFVVSNSWLDVDFGSQLQKRLLDTTQVLTILDSALERQFSTAAINTVISIIKNSLPRDDDIVRFVNLRGPFQQAVRDHSLQRVRTFTRRELLTAGTVGTEYVTPKWGAKYLRAPDVYFDLIRSSGERLVHLEDVITISRGITCGENNYFYVTPTGQTRGHLIEVTNAKGFHGYIEDQYLKPLIKSPRELRTLDAADASNPMLVFLCGDTKSQLQGRAPYALAFIEWGEAQNIHLRATVQGRTLWYDLDRSTPPDLILPKSVGESFRVFINTDAIVDQRLIEGFTQHDRDFVAAIGNSTLLSLVTETNTRTGLGDGLIDMAVGDIARFPFPNPDVFTRDQREQALAAFEALRHRPLRSIFEDLGFTDARDVDPDSISLDHIDPDRKRLDDAVFGALGVPQEMRLEIYRETARLIHNRLERANTIS